LIFNAWQPGQYFAGTQGKRPFFRFRRTRIGDIGAKWHPVLQSTNVVDKNHLQVRERVIERSASN
jgi:hypothetical protein